MYITPNEYIEIIRREYLQDFILHGGTAVKFLVPTEEIDHKVLQHQLCNVAEADGYLVAAIDAAKTGVHAIDQIFHEAAKQVDWDDLAFSFVSRILSDNGYKIPPRQEFNIRTISALNELDETLILFEVKKLLVKNLLHDYKMCQEFRIAMMRLCMVQLNPGDEFPVHSDAIKAWLRGELRSISAIKQAFIFQKISRQNARHILSSLSHWVHLTGRSGLFILLDISRCLVQRPRPKDIDDTSRYYTNTATLDVYEVLRQFIDTTDEMEYCFIAVIAAPPFLHSDNQRGVHIYDALKMRIMDEVRDRNRINPFSSLIRLSPCPDSCAINREDSYHESENRMPQGY